MSPEINQHIKCIFRNGTIIEGIVQVWKKNEAILLSLHDNSLMIIMKPEEDIMLIKILMEQKTKTLPQKNEEIKKEIRNKLKTIETVPISDLSNDLQKKNISELKRLVIKQEQSIIAGKIKDNFANPNQAINKYGSQLDIIRNK